MFMTPKVTCAFASSCPIAMRPSVMIGVFQCPRPTGSEATSRRFLDEGARVAAIAVGADEVATAAERIPGARLGSSIHSTVDGGRIDVALATADVSLYRAKHRLIATPIRTPCLTPHRALDRLPGPNRL